MNLPLANTDCVEQDEFCKNDTHGRKSGRELFCVAGRDSELVNIDDLY